jgi:hypothetical protein
MKVLQTLEKAWREAEDADLIVGCWYDRDALVQDALAEELTGFDEAQADAAFAHLKRLLRNTGGFDRDDVIDAVHGAMEI